MTRAMIRRSRSTSTERRRRRGRSAAAILVLALGATLLPTTPAVAADPEVPPAVDPGTPEFTGLDDPVPDGPVPFDPTRNMLQAFFDADGAAGGDSYWIDRVLERPGEGAGGAGERALYTKGSALFMYTHSATILGFAGQGTGANQGGCGFGYREPIAQGVTNLYTVTVSGDALAEQPDQRRQYPSHWFSVHTGGGLQVDQTKFITAASELARNAVIYGGGGRMDWEILENGARKGLRLDFRDEGPGIADLKLAMTDGWTSGTGLGLGLTGAKRLVDQFDIDTAPGRGTRVTIVKWA